MFQPFFVAFFFFFVVLFCIKRETDPCKFRRVVVVVLLWGLVLSLALMVDIVRQKARFFHLGGLVFFLDFREGCQNCIFWVTSL